MTVRTYRECDGPHCTERIQSGAGDPRYAFWYSVDRNDPAHWVEAGNSDRFDFCSLPCLAAWASSRELIRAAS